MNFAQLVVPEKEGDTLLVPPLDDYGAIIEANRCLNGETKIKGGKLHKLAAEARRVAIEKAREYTMSLGLNTGPEADLEKPLIVAGHQPSMFHPGVALKSMAMVDAAAKIGATPLFVTVDSDEFRSATVSVPVMDGSLKKKEFKLFPQSGKTIYETAQVEPVENIRERFQNILGKLDHPKLKAPADALASFLERFNETVTQSKNFTSLSIIMRRRWEAPVADNFLELPVSVMCGSRPFLKFAADIVERIEEFAAIYNDELRRYRKERKLRYPANPFPDLEKGDGRMETPFWIISEGTRERLHVTTGSEKLVFSETMSKKSMDDFCSGAVAIRPRAILLTMYIRLFVSDLFIHGVGGAKYDIITDRIIGRFYGIAPPRYTCVSGTARTGVLSENPEEKIGQVVKSLRDIEQHPETMADGAPEHVRALALEKMRLVEEIRKPEADKKSIGSRIKKLNVAMATALAPTKKRLEEELQKLLAQKLEYEVATARDYPFFFYNPRQVYDLLSQG